MGRVTAICQSGLGNRIIAIIGGYNLAQKLNYDFRIAWIPDKARDFRFNDLFINTLSVVDKWNIFDHDCLIIPFNDFYNDRYQQNFSKRLKYKIAFIPVEGIIFDKCKRYQNIAYKASGYMPDINTHEITSILTTLKIKYNILYDVLSFCLKNNVTDTTYSYHFRHTPNFSISEQQKQNIYTKIKNDSSRQYFICSDFKSVEEKFKTLPNVISFPKKEYPVYSKKNPNTVITEINRESAIEGFKDLLILSRTIIQNTYKDEASTFLKLAIWYQHLSLGRLIDQKILFSQVY